MNTRKTERGAGWLLRWLEVRAAPFALLIRTRKTERGAVRLLGWLEVRAAPFALLIRTRKTERGAGRLLGWPEVRAAPFALLIRTRRRERGAGRLLGWPEVRAAPFALLIRTRKTERGAGWLLRWLEVRAAPLALLIRTRRRERGAGWLLRWLEVRAAPFALLISTRRRERDAVRLLGCLAFVIPVGGPAQPAQLRPRCKPRFDQVRRTLHPSHRFANGRSLAKSTEYAQLVQRQAAIEDGEVRAVHRQSNGRRAAGQLPTSLEVRAAPFALLCPNPQIVHRVLHFQQTEMGLEPEGHVGAELEQVFRPERFFRRTIEGFDVRPFQTDHVQRQLQILTAEGGMLAEPRFEARAKIAQSERGRRTVRQICL
jgi:hypothetical protein